MYSSLPFKYMFISVVIFGTALSVSSTHWLSVWAGLEINLIGFLPVLVYQKSILESESAVKYFVIQALGSSFLMFGSLMSFNLSLSWESLTMSTSSLSCLLILLMGLMLKMGVFPFHFWFPGVMSGLSWFSCLLLGTWQKVAPIFLILALTSSLSSIPLVFLICVLAAGSSLVGGAGGLNQTQIRSLIAYSSIGHMGWVLFGLSSSENSMKLYFSIYVIISICLFFSLWMLDAFSMKMLGSLSNSAHLGAISLLIILLSLGGLPPLLGFISKWAVISTTTVTSTAGLLLALILGSLMSLFYYLSLFFSEVLALKSGTFSFKYLLSGVNHNYINAIVLGNVLGGLVFFLMGVQNFM